MLSVPDLLKDDVDAALEPLLGINAQLVDERHQLLHLLQRQLVEDATQLAIQLLQQSHTSCNNYSDDE